MERWGTPSFLSMNKTQKMNIIQFPKLRMAVNKHPKFRIDNLMEDVYNLILERLNNENLLPSLDHEEFIQDLGWAMAFTRCSLYSLIDQKHDLEEFSELVKFQYNLIKEEYKRNEKDNCFSCS